MEIPKSIETIGGHKAYWCKECCQYRLTSCGKRNCYSFVTIQRGWLEELTECWQQIHGPS